MRSRIVLFVVFALIAVAPVISAPTPAQAARDIQHPPPPQGTGKFSLYMGEPHVMPKTVDPTQLGVDPWQSDMKGNSLPLPKSRRSSPSSVDLHNELPSPETQVTPRDLVKVLKGASLDVKRDIPPYEAETRIERRSFFKKLFHKISGITGNLINDASQAAVQVLPAVMKHL